jgi:hypothetical protein
MRKTLSTEERANYVSSDQTQSETQIDNDSYLKIWQADQEYIRTRWTVTTFFMSVSFAISGFSFQANIVPPERLAIRIAAFVNGYFLKKTCFYKPYESLTLFV